MMNDNCLTLDLETPEPTYNVIKVTPGSFHQGNVKFLETAGLQCGINSMV